MPYNEMVRAGREGFSAFNDNPTTFNLKRILTTREETKMCCLRDQNIRA